MRDRRAYVVSAVVLALYSVGVWIFTDEVQGAADIVYVLVVLAITLLFAWIGAATRRRWRRRSA